MSEDRLMRTRLLLGDEKITRLRQARVMIVGCGAVGSYAIEALARSGIGHLKLIDFDKIEVSNINRQLFALTSTIGQAKTEVAKRRIKDISCDILVDTFNVFLDEKNADELIDDVDFVIDAIDSKASKIALYKACIKKEIPFISSMGAALHSDASKIKIDKMKNTSVCPLASAVRQLCKKEKINMDFPAVFSVEAPLKVLQPEKKQLGSLSTITGIFGLMIANYVIDKIINVDSF